VEKNELKRMHLQEILVNDQVSKIFLFLRTQKEPMGVREIQRALNFSSVGSTNWHLQKLLENGALEKVQGNRYKIDDYYIRIKEIPIKIMLNHYFIGNKLVPNVFFLLFFIINILLLEIFLIIVGNLFLGCLIAIIAFLYIIYQLFSFYYKIISSKDIKIK